MCKTCTTFSARPSLQNDMDGGVAAALIEEEAEQRACPDLDAHWRLDEAMDRAEKAERERDEWKDSAIKAMADLERAEQPRPLTPDAIESVLHDILPLSTEHLKADDIANIASDLHAALTEPTRPTELQVLAKVSAYMDEAGGEGIDAVTDFLAERGVRVVTEEQP